MTNLKPNKTQKYIIVFHFLFVSLGILGCLNHDKGTAGKGEQEQIDQGCSFPITTNRTITESQFIEPVKYGNYTEFHVITYVVSRQDWHAAAATYDASFLDLTYSELQIDPMKIGAIKAFIQRQANAGWKPLPVAYTEQNRYIGMSVDTITFTYGRFRVYFSAGPDLAPATCRFKLFLVSPIMVNKYNGYDWSNDDTNRQLIEENKNRIARRSFLDFNYLLSR